MSGSDSKAHSCGGACRALEFVESSIGKKMLVGGAGLLLCGFLVAHLAGNLFLFVGAPAFNHYAETLEANVLLPLAEFGLIFLFAVHILLSLRARWIDCAARPVGYASYRSKGGRTAGSRTILFTGLLVLLFLAVHIATFKFGLGAPAAPGGEEDLYGRVVGFLHNPLYSGFYLVALAALCLHLSHGVQSAFQTFGLNHDRYTPLIKLAGRAFAALIFLGFASMPLYFGFLK